MAEQYTGLIVHIGLFMFLFLSAGLIKYLTAGMGFEVHPQIDRERLKCESPIECRVYDALKVRGYHVRTQYSCGRFRVDIVVLPNLAIECDGYQWHSTPAQKAHNRKKDRYLSRHGWKVLRFTGRQINRDLYRVIRRIENEVKKEDNPFP